MPSLALACRLSAVSRASRRPFSPASLFSSGEQGVWYDPSDFSTLFQDAAGTIPVTAVEQPVGLILDKSKGLVLGPELVAQPINFNANWIATPGGGPVASGSSFTTVSIGGFWIKVLTPGKTYQVTVNGSTTAASGVTLRQTNTLTAAQIRAGFGQAVFTASTGFTYFYIRNESAGTTTVTSISVRELLGNHAMQTTTTSRPVLSARVNLLTGTETLATQTVTTRATTQTLRFEGAGTVMLSGTATGTYSAGSHSVTTTAGNLTLTVSGTVTKADLRATNMGVGLPAYQRVNTSTDYDTAGFPMYLRFDGVDDGMQTGNIDFTGTDKMTVWAGVRKLRDSTAGVFLELSANQNTNAGSFLITIPNGANTMFAASLSEGDSSIYNAAEYTDSAAPLTTVNAVLFDKTLTSFEVIAIRKNGADQSLTRSPNTNTTGNFGNYPLYIGSRGGITLPFNGHLYSLIVRGAQSSEAQILSAETYCNQKTGAY